MVKFRFIFAAVFCLLVSLAGAGRLELVTSVPLERARQIDFQGNFAWVAQNMNGATLIDINDPVRPKLLRRFLPGEMQPLYLQVMDKENLLVTADRFRGLVIYDISTADSPTTVSVLPLDGMTTHLDVAETTDGLHMAVLARAGEGLLCVDITDPSRPQITDEFSLGVDFTRAVAVADGIVYAADSVEGGLKALRLVSPGRLEPLYQANLAGKCQSLTVDGDNLFVGYYVHGFRIFRLPDMVDDPADTSSPLTLITHVLRNRNRVQAIATSGTTVVVANAEMGIDLYDAADLSLPCLRDEYLFKTRGVLAQSCAVYRKHIYIPAWEAGLLVFQLADSPEPSDFNLENVNYAAELP